MLSGGHVIQIFLIGDIVSHPAGGFWLFIGRKKSFLSKVKGMDANYSYICQLFFYNENNGLNGGQLS